MAATHNPQDTQFALLARILKQGSKTEFGKDKGISELTSYEAYKAAVPVQSYEDLRFYIENQDREMHPYLNLSQPIMYMQTSGTSGKPKNIPVLNTTISDNRRSQSILSYAAYKDIPSLYSGKIFAIVSPAEEGRLESGTPYGSMSGLLYQSMPKLVARQYVVPPHIFDIHDYELKYYLMTAFAMVAKDLSLIATANPSTLVKINSVMQEKWQELMVEIEQGNTTHGLAPCMERANELRALKADVGEVTFADLWPYLKGVATWTAGNCALQLPKVRALLPKETRIIEMGYLSSEFRGSLTVDVINNRSIPAFYETFFEFIERDDWEEEAQTFLLLNQLEVGKQYYVFATTQNGLYRYDINDIIEVDGHFNSTPTIRFVQKGKGVTNLTGEKLYESQVIAAMDAFAEMSGAKLAGNDLSFFMMLGCPKTLRYTLYIEAEPIAEAMEQFESCLSALNVEFRAKRQSGRLKDTAVKFLSENSGESYKKQCIEQGQREGQFKTLRLQYLEACDFEFDNCVRTM